MFGRPNDASSLCFDLWQYTLIHSAYVDIPIYVDCCCFIHCIWLSRCSNFCQPNFFKHVLNSKYFLLHINRWFNLWKYIVLNSSLSFIGFDFEMGINETKTGIITFHCHSFDSVCQPACNKDCFKHTRKLWSNLNKMYTCVFFIHWICHWEDNVQ